MKRKKILTVILAIAVLLPGSAFHDMILLLLLVWLWRAWIRERLRARWKYAYRSLWIILGTLTLLLMPRPFALPTDRVRLVYMDREGKRVPTPLVYWLAELVLPEETVCAAGTVGAALSSAVRYAVPAGGSIMRNFDEETRRLRILRFGDPYRNNSLALEAPLSGAAPQLFRQMGHGTDRAFYVIRPRRYDSGREYPVLFFCHGYLGNWKLYTGILRGIEDHIVVCIGTDDLSGLFSRKHIKEIRSLYLPLLAEMGYKVDPRAVSIMGLSNGGTAADAAYAWNPDAFRHIIYVSTNVNHTAATAAKVMVIGGGKDPSASSMRTAMRRLKKSGQRSAFHFDEDQTHFILLADMNGCLRFLIRELPDNAAAPAGQ